MCFHFMKNDVLFYLHSYIFKQKSIAGSCGGLGASGIDKACDCPEPCDRKKARLERDAAREEKLKAWKDQQIL
jgi:hypothetical protein